MLFKCIYLWLYNIFVQFEKNYAITSMSTLLSSIISKNDQSWNCACQNVYCLVERKCCSCSKSNLYCLYMSIMHSPICSKFIDEKNISMFVFVFYSSKYGFTLQLIADISGKSVSKSKCFCLHIEKTTFICSFSGVFPRLGLEQHRERKKTTIRKHTQQLNFSQFHIQIYVHSNIESYHGIWINVN